MPTCEFSLVRKYFTDTYTIGKLSVDGTYLCDTLEPVVRDLHDINHDGDFTDPGEGKIMGKTAIPYGRYQILFQYWKKHNKMAPLLQDVPGFTGIYIHSGNTADDTQGCILPGENKAKGQVLYSKYHTRIIEDLIRLALHEKKEIWITVK
jgi:hypothetical protein